MFTGIIEAVGEVAERTLESDVVTLTITHPAHWKLSTGQSIAVNGVCLTVTDFSEVSFVTELMPETQKKTTFASELLTVVNLERAMPADGRFEGHVVQGHVDCVGTIEKIEQAGETALWTISYPNEYQKLLVEKGSATVDGVSLTVISAEADRFAIGLIPHTLKATTLQTKQVGDAVNMEFDILGKYLIKHYGRS